MLLDDFQSDINPKKIREYLLNLDYTKRKSKAKWFLGRGFNFENRQQSLADHGKRSVPVKEEKTAFDFLYR